MGDDNSESEPLDEPSSRSSEPSDSPPAKGGEAFVDELPEDLDAAAYVGPYQFPDNSRRRLQALVLAVVGAGSAAIGLTAAENSTLDNRGFILAAGVLVLGAAYLLVAGVPLTVREHGALVIAARSVDFPVGPASAQLGWRGWRSRPTWRILVYSAEEPPLQRGFVLVDAVDGYVLDTIVEDNPEDWSL